MPVIRAGITGIVTFVHEIDLYKDPAVVISIENSNDTLPVNMRNPIYGEQTYRKPTY